MQLKVMDNGVGMLEKILKDKLSLQKKRVDKVAIVILNWNGKELLEKYLPSVVEFSNEPGQLIYVIDNGSTDDSVLLINAKFPTVRIIKLEKNYGFADGYNRGLKEIDAEYFILLNSDVEVTKGWITPLIKTVEANSDVVACQPKIRAYLQKDQFEYAGAAGGYIDRFGFPFCRGRLFNVFETDSGQYNKQSEIFWATGACLFVKAEQYFKVGGLDADFFAHMEEIDLCWRLLSRGFKIMYVPDSIVYHLGGATLSKTNPHKTFLNFRNNLYLLYKNLPKGKVFRLIFLRMVLDGIAAIKFVLSLEFDNFYAVLRSHLIFYASIHKFQSKRKENLRHMKTKEHSTMYKHSIVADFFLRKKKYFSELHFNP